MTEIRIVDSEGVHRILKIQTKNNSIDCTFRDYVITFNGRRSRIDAATGQKRNISEEHISIHACPGKPSTMIKHTTSFLGITTKDTGAHVTPALKRDGGIVPILYSATLSTRHPTSTVPGTCRDTDILITDTFSGKQLHYLLVLDSLESNQRTFSGFKNLRVDLETIRVYFIYCFSNIISTNTVTRFKATKPTEYGSLQGIGQEEACSILLALMKDTADFFAVNGRV